MGRWPKKRTISVLALACRSAALTPVPPPPRFGLAPIESYSEEGLWCKLDAAQSRSDADVALDELKRRGVACRWRSAEVQPVYSVSIEQLRLTTRAGPEADIADIFGALGAHGR